MQTREIQGNFVTNNLVLYSDLFNFVHSHICRWDQCAVYILYSKIPTDPGLLKIRHSHRFVAVVIQFLIPFSEQLPDYNKLTWLQPGLQPAILYPKLKNINAETDTT